MSRNSHACSDSNSSSEHSTAPGARELWLLKVHLCWDCPTLSFLATHRPQLLVRHSCLWVCQRRACCRACERAHWTLQSPRQVHQKSEPQRLASTAPQTSEWRLELQRQASGWGLQTQTAARKAKSHVGSGVAHSEQAARCIGLSGAAAQGWCKNMPEGTSILQRLGCTLMHLCPMRPTAVWPQAGLPPEPLPTVLVPGDACSARGACQPCSA